MARPRILRCSTPSAAPEGAREKICQLSHRFRGGLISFAFARFDLVWCSCRPYATEVDLPPPCASVRAEALLSHSNGTPHLGLTQTSLRPGPSPCRRLHVLRFKVANRQLLMKWEFPRLCRGGSQTLRIPGVYLPLVPSFLPKPVASRASCRCSCFCFSPVAGPFA